MLLAHADRYLLEEARRARRARRRAAARGASPSTRRWRGTAHHLGRRQRLQVAISIEKGDVDAALAAAERRRRGRRTRPARRSSSTSRRKGMIAVASPERGRHGVGLAAVPLLRAQGADAALRPARRSKVRVVQTETGGGFGGKEEYPSIDRRATRRCSRWKAGRPVKMIYDRAEDMAATTKRHPSRTRHPHRRSTRDGRLVAHGDRLRHRRRRLRDAVAGRALARHHPRRRALRLRRTCASAAARWPPTRRRTAPSAASARRRASSRSSGTWTRSPRAARPRARGAAAPQLRCARATRLATGQVIRDDVDMPALLDRALRAQPATATSARASPRAERRAARVKTRHRASPPSCTAPASPARARSPRVGGRRSRRPPSGRVRVLAASTEIGQGTNTVFAQIAADALGLALRATSSVAQPDTGECPTAARPSPRAPCMVVGKLVESAARALRADAASTRAARARRYTPRRIRARPARASTASTVRSRRRAVRAAARMSLGRRDLPAATPTRPTPGRCTSPRSRSTRSPTRRASSDFVAVQEVGKVDPPGARRRADRGRRGAGHRLRAVRERRVEGRARWRTAAMTELHHADRRPTRRRSGSFFVEAPYAARPGRRQGHRRAARWTAPAPAIAQRASSTRSGAPADASRSRPRG